MELSRKVCQCRTQLKKATMSKASVVSPEFSNLLPEEVELLKLIINSRIKRINTNKSVLLE